MEHLRNVVCVAVHEGIKQGIVRTICGDGCVIGYSNNSCEGDDEPNGLDRLHRLQYCKGYNGYGCVDNCAWLVVNL